MLETRFWKLDSGYSILDSRYSMLDSRFWILDGCDGSLVNLVNMGNLVKWLFTIDNRLMVNLDPRLRHSGTSLTGLFGVSSTKLRQQPIWCGTIRAVLRYIYRLRAVYVSLPANMRVF